MDKTQKDNIQHHRNELLTSMPPEHMKNKLITSRIFSIDDGQEIDAIATHKKKNEVILTKVLQSASPDAYHSFIKALQTIPHKSNYLAKLVDGCHQNATDQHSHFDMQLSQISAGHNVGTSAANQLDVARYFYDVANKLQQDWIRLANKLDILKKIDIESIVAGSSDDFGSADDFLCQWKDKYSNSATVRRLISALKAIGRGDIAAIDNPSTPSHGVASPTVSDDVDASTCNPMQTSDNTYSAAITGDPRTVSQSVAPSSAINNDPVSNSDSEQLPETVSLKKELANKPKRLKQLHCKEALQRHWKKFVDVVPAYNEHFLSELNHEGILGDWYFEEIKPMKHNRDKSQKLYDIITRERDVDDFIKLCVILRNSRETRNFGYSLQFAAYKLCQKN